jgi:transketolase
MNTRPGTLELAASTETIDLLKTQANQIRVDILAMVHAAHSGHPGGSLSATDLLTALYFHFMRVDPARPDWPDRDRFILSKGHACPVWYATLARRGYFPVDRLKTLRQINSTLQGHPDMLKTPGLDMTTGSLGQGLSVGVGMGLGLRLDGRSARVYVVMGDGELDEGQVWEAAMAAAKFKLDNLLAIVDYNNLQLDGTCDVVMPIEPLAAKWRAFNWRVFEMDGNDMRQIVDTLQQAQAITGQPSVIIAKTIKGKGVSFMENQCDWHGRAPSDEQYEQAIRELENSVN